MSKKKIDNEGKSAFIKGQSHGELGPHFYGPQDITHGEGLQREPLPGQDKYQDFEPDFKEHNKKYLDRNVSTTRSDTEDG
jgi:hypothetical protein